ncbi:hypothetical protein HRbin02_00279 [Candidatus Calditenuaceae archaeon HR02]|nr:hypothetical protein HRbin02_00279 [Candidatus Calditenuaceae archaeon HR02]
MAENIGGSLQYLQRPVCTREAAGSNPARSIGKIGLIRSGDEVGGDLTSNATKSETMGYMTRARLLKNTVIAAHTSLKALSTRYYTFSGRLQE